MEYRYTLTGETPAKKNSLVRARRGGMTHTQAFFAWHDSASLEISRQRYPPQPLSCPLCVSVEFMHGSRARRDSDNALTTILDLLKDVAIIRDDCWSIVRELHVTNTYSKGRSGCVITITDYREKE